MLLNKIVVAEDDDAISHMVNMALGDGGYLCLRASDGEEAVNMVRMHTPDLLILDVMLPRLDGIEVAKRLKGDVLLSKTPILMLTALASVDQKVAGLEAGADDYLVKPFDLRELTARVRALIRSARREGDRNPTTSLPGTASVEDKISQVVRAGEDAAVLHFDIRDFGRFADSVGYALAETFVAKVGNLVLDTSRSSSAGPRFIGHLGGADFIAITSTATASAFAAEVVDRYEATKGTWAGEIPHAAEAELVVAIASVAGITADNQDAVAARMATTMRMAKQNSGSNYVVWAETTE